MSKSHHTPQQRQAIDAQAVSVVLSSGAGCGKTSVLTARYLKHLEEDGVDVAQIVAITFTERAAREMRDRIRSAILERTKSASVDAAARWRDQLRNLESASICTIHSFCGNILRQYALAAGLDPRFEILEEVLAGNLRAESLRNCLQELLPNKNHPAGEDLRNLVVDYGWNATVEAIRHLTLEPDPAAWKIWLAQRPEQIEKSLGAVRDHLRRRYVDYLVSVDNKIAPCLDFLRSANCTGAEMKANVARILAETPALGTVANLATAVDELQECAKVGKDRAKAWDNDDAVYERVKKAFEGFRKALGEKLAPFLGEPENVLPGIRAGQRFIRVALEAAEAYQQRKQRAGYLDFQDLLVLTRDLLRDREDVRRALQDRFRYILLDEMQDTDPVQMELIRSLCSDVEIESGKLFAVGDQKQSIYRFRGADVRLFRQLRESVPERGRLKLTCNFRSQAQIIDFVNALCAKRISDYEPLEAHQGPLHDEPCIEFLWSVPDADAGQEFADDMRKREADAIARRIKSLLADGIPRIADRTTKALRVVKMEDVVLLFRSMSNVAIYEDALRRHGLDYYLVGGRAFFAQQEIYDLHHLLRALESPDDSFSLAGALRSPFCCLSDEALFVLSLEHRGQLWNGLRQDPAPRDLPKSQIEPVRRARENLERWRHLKDRLPIARLIAVIFADSGYDAAMQFESLGDRKLANLWKLQELARTFDRSGNFGLADFIQRLGELVRDQPREEQAATLPEKANVVKLMSIHQAKGLEFPVVVIPDAAAKTFSGQSSAAQWNSDLGCVARPPADIEPPIFSEFISQLNQIAEILADHEEYLRVLYVACTRAADLLILSAGLDEHLPGTWTSSVLLKNPNNWMRTLSERFNLVSGECIADDVPPDKRPKVRVEIVEGIPAMPASVKPKKDSKSAVKAVLGKPLALPEDSLPSVLLLPVLERMAVKPDHDSRDWRPMLDGNRPELFQSALLSPEERLLREVFDLWDFRDENGWKSVLRACVSEQGANAEAAEKVTAWSTKLTASDLYAELQNAEVASGNEEFLLQANDSSVPLCRGWFDISFRDADGQLKIIAFHLDGRSSLKEAAKARKPFLALQADALIQQIDNTSDPVELHLYDVATGKMECVDGLNPEDGWRTIKRLLLGLRK